MVLFETIFSPKTKNPACIANGIFIFLIKTFQLSPFTFKLF